MPSAQKTELDHYKIPKKIASSTAFERFLGAIDNPITKQGYLTSISLYIKSLKAKTASDLIDGDNIALEDKVMDFITRQKLEGISPASIRTRIAAVQLFYDMNRKPLSWRIIGKMIPKTKRSKDRGWQREEIQKMLPFARLRDQAIILLFSSTGMRKGGLHWKDSKNVSHHLLMKHLIPRDEWGIYQIIVYDGEAEEYHTYCTPEARAKLEEYFQYRKRYGETLTPDSPVFRKEWDMSDAESAKKPKPITVKTIDEAIRRVVIAAGLRVEQSTSSKVEAAKVRHDQKLVHGFRKFYETSLLDAGFESDWVDMLEGHKLRGLRDNYYRPKDDTVLLGTITADGKKKKLGYVDIMGELVISDEERLNYEVKELRAEAKEIDEMKLEAKKKDRQLKAQGEKIDQLYKILYVQGVIKKEEGKKT